MSLTQPWIGMVLGVFVAGCAAAPLQAHAPLSVQEQALFEHGIDWISSPTALQGQWKEQWDEELRRRVRDADLIATCVVSTLRTDTDHDQRMVHRMSVKLNESYKGEFDTRDIELKVSDDQPGFASVDASKDRVLDRSFVVFVRWAPNARGKVQAHFHLITKSTEIIDEIARWLGQTERETRRGESF